MEKFSYWLIRISFFSLAILSESSVANMENSVTLKLSFDKYSVPHTTFIIDGQPIYAMVDTGSVIGFHLYGSQINKIKGLKKESTYHSTDLTGKNQENITYLADSLDINHIKLENVTVTPFKQWGFVISDKGKLPDVPVAGLGAFKDKRIMLDYSSNLLTITDNPNDKTKVPKNFKAFPFHISPDGMIFDVEQSGHKYRMILDTGATVSMIWRERLKSYTPASCLVVHPEMDNKECEATMLTVKSITGEPVHFGAVIVDGHFQHMGEVDGLIGNNFLKNRKIIIDFRNKKVFVSDEHRKG
ncbi:hypothetical protein [Xenorhabdus entomophaga]|uniref:hypothetical protein n=1 Tax=Xenorhabdus entomophaga TaxID=3136257 RepID=UPI0030F46935